jgi:hypothetical protein
LVLPGFNLYEALKIDDPKKLAWKEHYFDLRGRHLEQAVLNGADRRRSSAFSTSGPRVPARSVARSNGNHEMYSGGFAYFDDILPKFSQLSSYFALQNTNGCWSGSTPPTPITRSMPRRSLG